jgi:DNA-binding phage protein
MADYTPTLIKEYVVRNWFDPPLSEDDLTKASLLIHIEAVEKYINDVYELTSSADARIPALLLVVSRIINMPSIAKSHYTLRRETVRNYSYELDTTSSPNVISLTLEKMAERMLNARSYVNSDKLKIFISNS